MVHSGFLPLPPQSDQSMAKRCAKTARTKPSSSHTVELLDELFQGTVGRLALASTSTPIFVYAPQFCFWRSTDHSRLSPFVLHQWMHDEEFSEQVDMTKGQTDMADHVSLTDQRRMHITLPPSKRQGEIERHLECFYGRIDQNTVEIATLSSLRDSLLPALLSGEIRLGEVQESIT